MSPKKFHKEYLQLLAVLGEVEGCKKRPFSNEKDLWDAR